MKHYGPFSTDASFFPDKTTLYYNVFVGRAGLIEFINESMLDITVTMPQGTIIIEQRSKTIWKIPTYLQGQVSIAFAPIYQYQIQPQGIAFFQNNPVMGTASVLWINTYEDGETEWYPPIALGALSSSNGAAFFKSATAPNGVVTNIIIGPFVSYPNSCIFLWGVDSHAEAPSATANATLTISGLIGGQINYEVGAFLNSFPQQLSVRYSPPLSSTAGGSITVSAPAWTANRFTTVYYTVP